MVFRKVSVAFLALFFVFGLATPVTAQEATPTIEVVLGMGICFVIVDGDVDVVASSTPSVEVVAGERTILEAPIGEWVVVVVDEYVLVARCEVVFDTTDWADGRSNFLVVGCNPIDTQIGIAHRTLQPVGVGDFFQLTCTPIARDTTDLLR
jgi:hypothetical protein